MWTYDIHLLDNATVEGRLQDGFEIWMEGGNQRPTPLSSAGAMQELG